MRNRYEKTAYKILDLINSPQFKARTLILKPQFIICGISGSGKTYAIELANEKLPDNEKIAESTDILFCSDAESAEEVILKDDSRYEEAKYIAYSTVRRDVGENLASKWYLPVIFVE